MATSESLETYSVPCPRGLTSGLTDCNRYFHSAVPGLIVSRIADHLANDHGLVVDFSTTQYLRVYVDKALS